MTPIATLGWAGCSDGNTGTLALDVDPGGTFGAEVTVSVIGRGRVTTNVGLDCPSDCFGKYIFANNGADGAAGGVSLTATPTRGGKFIGWSFNVEPLGSRGRGPESCNPVLRAGSNPSVETSAREITLPYGEVTGTSPAGQEAACTSYTRVPVVYNVTATFDTDLAVVDVDSGVDNGDGGIAETAYLAPSSYPNARNGEIGMTENSTLYWHFQSAGQSGIAYGSFPGGPMNQLPAVIAAPSSSFVLFEVDPSGVIYQDSLGTLRVIRSGSTMPTTLPSAPTCTAVAIDTSYNAYCRTATSIVRWDYPSYVAPITLYTGVAGGTSLLVESAFGSLYYTTSNAILSLPISGANGGDATFPTTVVSGTFGATNLEANTSRFAWIEANGSVYASTSKSSTNMIGNDMRGPTSTQWKHVAVDDQSSFSFWVASSSAIYHAYYTGSQTQAFRTGMAGLTGMTADSEYVYWTQGDGSVRRSSRAAF